MKTLAVVQARMASTRLPGKVMRKLGTKRAIGWVINAAMRAPGVDMVVVATSVNEENDILEGWCNQNGVRCYRGSEEDVLGRYVGLLDFYNPRTIVRLTGDCPLLDSTVIGSAIALHHATGANYTTNQWPPNWPDGLDVEVITTEALLRAGEEATSQIDRDTVTQFIFRNQSRWPSSTLPCPLPGLHKERWVLDSEEDLTLLKMIVESFPDDWEPNYLDIWNLLNENQEWRKINTNWTRNQRFFEAIADDESNQPKLYERTRRKLDRASRVIPHASQTYSKSCLQFPRGEAPLFVSHGSGPYLFDVDGNRFVDLVGALLPNILGYNDPDVDFAIRRQLDRGISTSLATEMETQLAETMVGLIPCAEMVRFGKNGSDATSAAVRLARYHTRRDFVAIIAGEGYHGWHDWAVAGTVRDAGVPGLVKHLTHRIKPELETIKECLCRHNYAAVMIDPENHDGAFLSGLQTLCNSVGALLVFDEIRTGFRYSLGGYQQYVNVIPDLACFGKSMGNGMPISALVGPKHLMEPLNSKDGPFWSGTFFGECLSLAAAIATVDKIRREGVIEYLWDFGRELVTELPPEIFTGSYARPLINQDSWAFDSDKKRNQFIVNMAQNGVLILNSNNLNFAMGKNEIDMIWKAYDKAIWKTS